MSKYPVLSSTSAQGTMPDSNPIKIVPVVPAAKAAISPPPPSETEGLGK